jgi:fido (protein-threonine AMPylation protein)
MNIPVKLYRVESQRLRNRAIYYLAKSVRLGKKVKKARVKLGETKPTPIEEKTLTSTPHTQLEIEILRKRVEAEVRKGAKYLEGDALRMVEESRHWEHFFALFLNKTEREEVESGQEIEYVAGTTAIEGNTFTVQQVDELIQRGAAPSGKSLREINEVQNYVQVAEYRKAYTGRVNQLFIKKIHALVMRNIDNESAGKFRRIDTIGIRGLDTAVTPSIMIEEELQSIIDKYYSEVAAGRNPFEEAILFHYRFEMIHPFTDGNGRVGREVLNYMLTRAGYPRLIVRRACREVYLSALRSGNEKRCDLLVAGFASLLFDDRAKLFKSLLNTA